ncbi:ABC transporter ATP-binding protein [Terrarubrum flagellatum]|uniref:ABC transporter ATP-binding protein n=1 Tax=Terrirubrum flagellatum TaxID=2895980 RepID=UPI00314538E8
MNASADTVLSIDDLSIEIGGNRIVDHVSLGVGAGRILAIVGESGSGKSLTALSILGLLPPAARLAGGAIHLRGRELTKLNEDDLADVRGNDATVIFQEPIASLNPLMRVGEQVEEALRLHRRLSAREARDEAIAMMSRVGIPDAARRARQYPFELSGGMCQRIMIAAALICRPALLIADEPTTALDVTIQAQILDLMRRLRDEVGAAIVLITHDMGVVADLADDVCVMYGGRIVESGPVEQIFAEPRHPYTKLLLATIPTLDGARKMSLRTIEGMVPTAESWPEGCRFRTRCPLAFEKCVEVPPLAPIARDHRAACWRSGEVEALA